MESTQILISSIFIYLTVKKRDETTNQTHIHFHNDFSHMYNVSDAIIDFRWIHTSALLFFFVKDQIVVLISAGPNKLKEKD